MRSGQPFSALVPHPEETRVLNAANRQLQPDSPSKIVPTEALGTPPHLPKYRQY
jgi:hypothetical protein